MELTFDACVPSPDHRAWDRGGSHGTWMEEREEGGREGGREQVVPLLLLGVRDGTSNKMQPSLRSSDQNLNTVWLW